MGSIKIYNLRIVPPEPVFGEIVQFKKQFEAVFGKQTLSKSKPHSTLAAFKMDVQYEEILIKAIDQLAVVKKFNLSLQGFDVFENNANTLFIKVSPTSALEQLYKHLKIIWIRDVHRKPSSIKISTTPHITISKTDGKKMLHESLAYFQKKNYNTTIAVNQLTLVSRYQNNTWDWEHIIPLT